MGIAVRLMDVEKAFKYLKRQHGVLKQTSPLHEATLLILFYAVECGAKAAYANKGNMGKHAWLDDTYTVKIGHNLNRVLKKLGISLTIPDVRSKTPKNGNALICPKDLHEAWRYGRSLEEDGQKDVAEKLAEALGKVNELLRGKK